MSRTELLTLALETRLAQLDLNAARRAHALGQVTDRELSMTEAERDSALEFCEEAWAAARLAPPTSAEVRTPADVWARVRAAKEAAMAELKSALPRSGYTDCACRDCFDTAISSDVRFPEPCQGCVEEDCELGDSECNQPDAYRE